MHGSSKEQSIYPLSIDRTPAPLQTSHKGLCPLTLQAFEKA